MVTNKKPPKSISPAQQKLMQELPKALTGIAGLDDITGGGLPKGRATLICGGTGSGKTMLAMEFLYRGAKQFDEPGVFVAFEESPKDLIANMNSIGLDLVSLIASKKLVLDFVSVNFEELVEAGKYDLEALFIRLGSAIDAIGAKRVVLDTIESLFSSLPNQALLRSELRRLFRWLKDRGVTAIITGESGIDTFTREGLEEYISDCVINLSVNIENHRASRSLRIVKYRGSCHGTNEYPFVIQNTGFSLIPITAGRLDYIVDSQRISSGVAGLDLMLDGKGFYRRSSILVSGSSGTGKSIVMSHFAEAACLRNERVLYFSFEESPSQITRNMLSAGIDLQKYIKKGLLYIESKRASQFSLDVHLLEFEKSIEMHKPNIVIIDPISSLMDIASQYDLKRALIKLVDYLHINDITIMIGSLVSSNDALLDSSSIAISSLVDSWILLRDVESYGERNRAMYIRKSRGMSHSNKVREFIITDHGIVIKDIFANNEGVLVGGAREAGIVKKDAQEILVKEALDQDIIKNLSNIKMVREQIIDIGHALTELEASNLIVINQQSQRKAPGIVARLSKPIKERPR